MRTLYLVSWWYCPAPFPVQLLLSFVSCRSWNLFHIIALDVVVASLFGLVLATLELANFLLYVCGWVRGTGQAGREVAVVWPQLHLTYAQPFTSPCPQLGTFVVLNWTGQWPTKVFYKSVVQYTLLGVHYNR